MEQKEKKVKWWMILGYIGTGIGTLSAVSIVLYSYFVRSISYKESILYGTCACTLLLAIVLGYKSGKRKLFAPIFLDVLFWVRFILSFV